jgi:hypothetical protein
MTRRLRRFCVLSICVALCAVLIASFLTLAAAKKLPDIGMTMTQVEVAEMLGPPESTTRYGQLSVLQWNSWTWDNGAMKQVSLQLTFTDEGRQVRHANWETGAWEACRSWLKKYWP